jgi:DNA topoisomerase-6 subunit B
VPIGEALLIEGLKRRFKAAFYVSTTRPPSVYRGNPFVVEVGLAYGGELPADEPAEIMRFANRVPLQYQPKACAISEAIYETNWRGYELSQPKGSSPSGRWRSSCTSPACGCRSRARPRRRSPTTTSSSRR